MKGAVFLFRMIVRISSCNPCNRRRQFGRLCRYRCSKHHGRRHACWITALAGRRIEYDITAGIGTAAYNIRYRNRRRGKSGSNGDCTGEIPFSSYIGFIPKFMCQCVQNVILLRKLDTVPIRNELDMGPFRGVSNPDIAACKQRMIGTSMFIIYGCGSAVIFDVKVLAVLLDKSPRRGRVFSSIEILNLVPIKIPNFRIRRIGPYGAVREPYIDRRVGAGRSGCTRPGRVFTGKANINGGICITGIHITFQNDILAPSGRLPIFTVYVKIDNASSQCLQSQCFIWLDGIFIYLDMTTAQADCCIAGRHRSTIHFQICLSCNGNLCIPIYVAGRFDPKDCI